jgi:hypothetical protein
LIRRGLFSARGRDHDESKETTNKSTCATNDQAAYNIRLIDMDGDGDLDVLIAGQQSQNVVWYENPHQ